MNTTTRRNIELKARLPNVEDARAVASRIGAEFVGELKQTDTYFAVANGRLKLRQIEGQAAELIGYERPDDIASRTSRYRLVSVAEPDLMKQTLGDALDVLGVVEKTRQLYLFENVRIHLDQVRDLGSFLEFEAVLGADDSESAGHTIVAQLRQQFGIADGDLLAHSYIDLLQERLESCKRDA